MSSCETFFLSPRPPFPFPPNAPAAVAAICGSAVVGIRVVPHY